MENFNLDKASSGLIHPNQERSKLMLIHKLSLKSGRNSSQGEITSARKSRVKSFKLGSGKPISKSKFLISKIYFLQLAKINFNNPV